MTQTGEKSKLSAAVIIIGNEILSGRTLDKNTQHIALKLGERGIYLDEVRVVPDDMERVVAAVNEIRARVDYVFTTGGIGPTHDDITVDCIAAAVGVDVEVNDEAYARLLAHYGADEFTPARQRMARIPAGAMLVDNPVSVAPGFVIENIHVMAGVPRIMQAMLDYILPTLGEGDVLFSRTVTCDLPESQLAKALGALQAQHPRVDIGSYPFFKGGRVGVSVVLRGVDERALDALVELVVQAAQRVEGA